MPKTPIPPSEEEIDSLFEGDAGERGPGGEEELPDSGLRGRATDFMRKAIVAGVGALFMTEEGIRNLVGELKLPKELIATLLSQADRTKQEVIRLLADELRHFFESAQLHQELLKLLTDVTIEVKTEIRLRPDGHKVKPVMTGEPSVRFRRGGTRRKDG
ncbi:MAG: hypothetical protein ACYCWW_00065 [Deltaproteobacteria bacterium]